MSYLNCNYKECSRLLVNIKKELELYKKALEISCRQNNTAPVCATEYHRDSCKFYGACGKCWENIYLQKARGEE